MNAKKARLLTDAKKDGFEINILLNTEKRIVQAVNEGYSFTRIPLSEWDSKMYDVNFFNIIKEYFEIDGYTVTLDMESYHFVMAVISW